MLLLSRVVLGIVLIENIMFTTLFPLRFTQVKRCVRLSCFASFSSTCVLYKSNPVVI